MTCGLCGFSHDRVLDAAVSRVLAGEDIHEVADDCGLPAEAIAVEAADR